MLCLLLGAFLIGCKKMENNKGGKLPDRIVEPECVDFKSMPDSTHDDREAEILKIRVR